ncbi:MAG: hypothetical protein ACK46X_02200 [Candidatus Sericytochromatia bacterium]
MEHVTRTQSGGAPRRHTTDRLRSPATHEPPHAIYQLDQAVQAVQEQRLHRRTQLAHTTDPILIKRLEGKLAGLEAKLNALMAIRRVAEQHRTHGNEELDHLLALIDRAMSGRADPIAIAAEAERLLDHGRRR